MIERRGSYPLIALLAGLSLLMTACFRDTSEAMRQVPVARQVASPTVVDEAEPTEAPPSAIEEIAPTEQEVDQFALTATALIALQTQAPVGGETSSVDEAVSAPEAQPTAIAVPRSTIPPGEDCVHEIRAGETLFQLSLAYGVTVNDIANASGIDNPDRIAVGQQVTIPKCGTTGFIPPPTSAPPPTVDPATVPLSTEPAELEIASADDARSSLIERAQTSLLDNAQTDTEIEFSIQSAALPTPGGTYTVQQNDTLFGIAIQLGTSVEVLAALNDITDVDSLNAGEVLQTP